MYLNATPSLLTDLIKNNKYFLKVTYKTLRNVNSYRVFQKNLIFFSGREKIVSEQYFQLIDMAKYSFTNWLLPPFDP
ncbi:hypothetical protein QE417_003445 [Mucilaginibacter terrae]|uniref:Uncharacterized protein n=1 Tax=Mucilaginibacter terrae TaxID=1955052 RepID=A0ABU3GX87_9SPHI|nr:hypothetical protein [Mucilaginibacter terrae]